MVEWRTGSDRAKRRARRRAGLRTAVGRMLSGTIGQWAVRMLIAIPGIAMICVGIGSSDTARYKVWHDGGLLFLLVSATLPLWRRPKRSFPEPVLWRELLRKSLRRTSAVLVFGAVGCLVAYRVFSGHGDSGAARTVAEVGGCALLAAVVLPPLERVLWQLFPDGLRRAERTALLMGEFNRSAVVPERRLVKDFDAGQGASGRPKAFVELLRKAPPNGQSRRISNHPVPGLGVEVAWDGTHLVVTSRMGKRVSAYPVVSQRSRNAGAWGKKRARRPVVAELVSLDARNRSAVNRASWARTRKTRLVLVDERGRRILTVRPFDCNWSQAIALAKAAGVSYAYYRVDFDVENADKILRLMFPWRAGSRQIRG